MQLHRPETIESFQRRETALLVISFAPLRILQEWLPFFVEHSLRPALGTGTGRESVPLSTLISCTRFLSDPGLAAYRAYGLGRLSPVRVLTPGILWQYARWALAGRKLFRAVGDGLQQGGDFVVAADGRLTLARPSAGPDDRPDAGVLLEALDPERIFRTDRLKSQIQGRQEFPSRHPDTETSAMMWKKNEPEEQPIRQPAPLQQAHPPVQPADRAVIGPTIEIKGNLKGEEDLLIQGAVEGKIELLRHAVTVGRKGRARADIIGRIICVEGEVHGNLFGEEQIILRSSSTVRGNLLAPRVTMEDGASFKGGIDMTQGTPAEAAAGTQAEKPERRMPLIQKPPQAGTAADSKSDLQAQRPGSAEPHR